MIDQTTAAAEAWATGTQTPHYRVKIEDDGGTLRNWTDLVQPDDDRVGSLEITESIDDPGRSLTCTLYWKRYQDNASPFVTTGRTAQWLFLNRQITVEVAIMAEGRTPSSSDWVTIFDGTIDRINLSNFPAQIQARDRTIATLQDSFIEAETEYGDVSTKDSEDVISDILTDYASSVTLYTPTASNFAIRKYKQQQMPVAQALDDIVVLNGWDIRMRWDSGTSSWRYTFYGPDRTTTTLDDTFSPSRYRAIQRAEIALDRIRNVVEVVYVDGTDDAGDYTTASVTRSDSASITRYGRRWMQITEGSTSRVDTQTEAETLGDAVLADLSEPDLEADIQLDLYPWVEVNDYHRLEADEERWGADQDLAVMGYTHSITAETATTTIRYSGQPKAGSYTWLEREARPGQGKARGDSKPAILASPSATAAIRGALVTWDTPLDGRWDRVEVHRSTTSGFTPGASTFRGAVRGNSYTDPDGTPGTDYYYKVVAKDRRGVAADPSAQTSVTADYVRKTDLEDRLRIAVALAVGADHTISTSGGTVQFDTVTAGNSAYADTANFEITPGEAGTYLVSASVTPDSGSIDVSSWRLEVREAGSSTPLLSTGDRNPDQELVIPGTLIDLSASDEIRCVLVFSGGAGTAAIDATGSSFSLLATLD
jgi:hypothetical protein